MLNLKQRGIYFFHRTPPLKISILGIVIGSAELPEALSHDMCSDMKSPPELD